VLEEKKKNISVRLNTSDLRKVQDIAKRLRVRDSDVYRFAIKVTLRKLMPLQDGNVKGSDLIPAFIECGSELTKFFDLDSDRLERIINGDLEDSNSRVDSEDIELIAMSGVKENYVYLTLKELASKQSTLIGPDALLRQHLHEKYLCNDTIKIDTNTEDDDGLNQIISRDIFETGNNV